MLVFENGNFINTIKGCHHPGFFNSIFDNAFVAVSADSDKPAKRVIVYTTPTCTWCTTIKAYLRKNGINYREVDVSKDQSAAEAMVRKSGQQGVPQTDINGEVVVGFDKGKINRFLPRWSHSVTSKIVRSLLVIQSSTNSLPVQN